jgi:small redox-active disulfide protein 2
MRTIKVFGSGCAKCEQLARNADAAAKQLGIEYQLEKVTDLKTLTEYGIMMTPALAVDGRVVAPGKVLTIEQIKRILS